MKLLLSLAFTGLFPLLAAAQAAKPPPDNSDKPKPFEPILAKDHAGPGRIGVRLDFAKDGTVTIGALTRGGPGADFGLRVGDVIIKIGKNYTYTLSEDECRLALHGEPGTGVELTLQRDDDPLLVVRAVERRVLFADQDEVTSPVSEVKAQ